MNAPIEICRKIYRHYFLRAVHRLHWLPGLLTRVAIGFVFAQSGWGKLHNLEKVSGFFRDLGIPSPTVMAPFVAGTEFVCGVFLIIGLFTRLVSIPMIFIMIVAILTAKLGELTGAGDLFGLSEFLMIVGLVWLVIFGPERVSLDRWLTRLDKI